MAEHNDHDDQDRPMKPGAHTHAAATAGHASDAAHDDHHGLAHITPVRLLLIIFGALMVLTVVTVAIRGIDLGGQWNLTVAMVIATLKAGLVVTYFMHLRWDRAFNVLVFLSSLLFLILFVSILLTDRREYQPDIDLVEQANVEQTSQ
jgi:cytochrome c oxidase subunit 4